MKTLKNALAYLKAAFGLLIMGREKEIDGTGDDLSNQETH